MQIPSLSRLLAASLFATALAACDSLGGGSGSGSSSSGGGSSSSGGVAPPPTPQPGMLQLAAATSRPAESAGNVVITVTRTGGSDGAVSATLATADGTATVGQDYTAVSTTVSFASGDAAPKTVSIEIREDPAPEIAETFSVSLSQLLGGATLGSNNSLTITIEDNDMVNPPAPPRLGHFLNDTGVTTCANTLNNGVACNSATTGTDQFPRQDAESGRDVTTGNSSDGHGGFSFTKLGADGEPLADQLGGYANTPWHCVRDNVTDLVWEVKTDNGGLRDRDSTYTWYDSSGFGNSRDSGPGNGGVCTDRPFCDTQNFAARVNDAALCAREGWRLPTRSELFSLVNHGATAPPFVDATFFANLLPASYWTSDTAGFQVLVLDTRRAALRRKDQDSPQKVLLVTEEQ